LNVSGDVTPQAAVRQCVVEAGWRRPRGGSAVHRAAYFDDSDQRTLERDAKVRYGPKKPALEFAGNISVAGLHTVDNALHDDFINWDRLDVSGSPSNTIPIGSTSNK